MLDIGCGSGSMFMNLLEAGTCENEEVDISGGMAEAAKEKFCFDPRIHVEKGDFLTHEQTGYDVLMAFNSYQQFLQPRVFLKKARELLRTSGRLTIAFPFDREHTNTISAILPAGLARGLLSVEEEVVFWR